MWDRDPALFSRMLELLVASDLVNLEPSVRLQKFHDFPAVHVYNIHMNTQGSNEKPHTIHIIQSRKQGARRLWYFATLTGGERIMRRIIAT